MTVVVDINVMLDVFQKRQPHFAASAALLNIVMNPPQGIASLAKPLDCGDLSPLFTSRLVGAKGRATRVIVGKPPGPKAAASSRTPKRCAPYRGAGWQACVCFSPATFLSRFTAIP